MSKEQTPPGESAIRSYTKAELARLYNVSPDTLSRWLSRYESALKKLGYRNDQKIFTVAQVKYLFQDTALGRP